MPGDESTLHPASAVTCFTQSCDLRPRNYSAWDDSREYPDETYADFVRDNAELFETAVAEFAASEDPDGTADGAVKQSLKMDVAREHFDRCGYGRAVISMEDFDVTRAGNEETGVKDEERASSEDKRRLSTCPCRYPTSSNLRCRYDHHTFSGIPILMPLRYHRPPMNMLEVAAHVVFCSFACALAYIERESPRLYVIS